MMRTRLVAGIASLLVVGAMPSAGASPSRPAAVVLRGPVTLTGSDSYVRDVVLPRAVTFQEQTWNTTWSITASRGRFAGYVLRRVGTDDDQVAFALKRGYCLSRACVHPSWVPFANGCVCGGRTPSSAVRVLPAGRYRLHLIADGAPVTVKITFPGLTGRSTTFRSGVRHRPVIDTPPPAVLDPPIAPPTGMGGNRYSAGATHTAPNGGIFFLVAWKYFDVSPPKSANHIGGCMSHGPPVPGPAGLYQYPCDVGSVGTLFVGGQVATGPNAGPMGTLPQYATGFEWFGPVGDARPGVIYKGTTSLGAYVNSHSPATEVHTQILWLDFLR
ncbi:MAG TPA: hypothetical protein VNA20_14295 [Frankiaceae bacterium]|nr:hypothetical protein [Frankiaceae bacterium]